MLIGSGVSAGTSLIGGALGARASSKAARTQAAAGRQASSLQDRLLPFAQSQFSPYMTAGAGAASQLSQMASSSSSPFEFGNFSFNPGDFQGDPGYQFRMKQGQQVLENSAAARGTLHGGNTMKGLIDYGQNFASNEFSNAYQRARDSYMTNYQTARGAFDANQGADAQQFGQLFNLANMGYGASSQLSGLYSDVLGRQGEYLTGIGNAQAAGQVGSANAWSNAFGNVANTAQMYGLYRGAGFGAPASRTGPPAPLPYGYNANIPSTGFQIPGAGGFQPGNYTPPPPARVGG
jgi:hypothetical protein